MGDTVTLRFALEWLEDAPGRPDRRHTELHIHHDAPAAIEAHHQACKGGWVRPGMRRPEVGPLQVWRGQTMAGVRKPGRTVPEFACLHPWDDELVDRRRAGPESAA